MSTEIAIIGGGIAGFTTALALQKIGLQPIIFESAATIKEIGAGLGLGANAIKAFSHLGIKEEVMAAGSFLSSFTVYDQKGKQITKTDSVSVSKKYGLDNFTIHRADLHQLLLSKIDRKKIYTNKRAESILQKGNNVTIQFQDGSTYDTNYMIAADGINSPIRKQLLPGSEPRYAGYTCWRAVIDNTQLQIKDSSETWGHKGRFGIVPLKQNRIYWFACINAAAQDMRMKQLNVQQLLEHFKSYHLPIPAILQETKNENLIWNDIIDLKPVNQFAFDNVLLTGDAAHATTPNLGQGACQAIEDAVILAGEIKKDNDIKAAFKRFEQRRIKRVHWIVNTSWQIGKIAQLENPLLISIRDAAFRLMPASMQDRQFEKLYKVDL